MRQAKVVASDETGVRIGGSNAYHWVFRCANAVVHHAASTRGGVVVRTIMDGHRPHVWLSDRYGAQQGHAQAHQTCLAHLVRDAAYAAETSDDYGPSRLALWMTRAFALARDIETLLPRQSRPNAEPSSQVSTHHRDADVLRSPALHPEQVQGDLAINS